MAVIIGRQKMTLRHAEGEHTIFPSEQPQSLPDHLLEHRHVKGGIESGWITICDAASEASEGQEAEVESGSNRESSAPSKRGRRSS